ncbi:methyltransferase domain-containing protein [Pedobacter petrophilus]|uniref:Methyltransferase domain-containing protein n=1 Tax=Pedobacter petrophilus TaxID=1908241 RepID=A0A7K0FXC8_9SPHI|nr:class I SAM-dependent methyltransferase [Pedobacter petrophilus]MRX75619.1 methyltransferase domain-containing protein [Pedobacter petrophilus]
MNNLEEEIFCLNFELNSFAEVMIKQESERWLPSFAHNVVEHDHIERYNLASKYVKDKKVLDLACGAGKGTSILATEGKAKSVLGGDLNINAVRYATHRYKEENNSYQVIDALNPNLEPSSFDVAVSFETIEHLPDRDRYLKNVKTLLKRDGVFIVSTPISSKPIDDKPENPYHLIEWGFINFQNYIKTYFDIEEVYIQLYPKKAHLQSGLYNRTMRKLGFKNFKNQVQEQFISKLEKFENQYLLSEIGYDRIGYQILICKNR